MKKIALLVALLSLGSTAYGNNTMFDGDDGTSNTIRTDAQSLSSVGGDAGTENNNKKFKVIKDKNDDMIGGHGGTQHNSSKQVK